MTYPKTTSERIVNVIADTMKERNRHYTWLARTSGVPYKRILAEIKHRTRPLSLETSIGAARALGLELPELLALAA